ncbi:hypothetical protein DPMN_155066 [Dreissena polymorpha]|uniref:Uncharacterized protein n=1 Tax=Dreissena polymorpha TaxID=45954 RepID=A0A9D4FR55_DREPO|nr:hypothetical protein DPMN_155066 [Dreissena polymorpha]
MSTELDRFTLPLDMVDALPLSLYDKVKIGYQSNSQRSTVKKLVEQKSGGAGAAGACRLWVGEHDRYGYGVLRATVAGKRIHFLAHRLAFFLHFLGVDVVLAVRTDSAPTPAARSRFVKNCSVPP